MGNKNIPSSLVQESADSLLEETCIFPMYYLSLERIVFLTK